VKSVCLVSLVLLVASACGDAGPKPVEDSPAEIVRDPGYERVAPFAGEWPRFRGPHQDGIAPPQNINTHWPEVLTATWEEPVGGGYSSMAVSSGRIVTMGRHKDEQEEIVTAFEATTGRRLWQAHYAANYEGISYDVGPRSTPTIRDGRVYTQGATGVVHAFDLVSGDVLWRNDVRILGDRNPPGYGYVHSLLVKDNLVFVQPGGQNGRSLAALHADTGDVVWIAHDEPVGFSSPLAISRNGHEEILFFTGEHVLAVDPSTGDILWRHRWATNHNLNAAMPIFSDGALFISSSYGMGGALLGLNDSETPDVLWESKAMKNHFSSSVLYDGHLYGFNDTILTALDWQTGRRGFAQRDYGKGSVVVVGDQLLVLSDEGTIAIGKADPQRFEPIAQTRVFDTLTWTVPVLTGGFLFVRDEQILKAFDLNEYR
jgi:outer membrane protein assembly factor BamB